MIRKSLFIYVLFLFIAGSAGLWAQEVEVPVSSNAVIRDYLKANTSLINKSVSEADTLELPFFDDFSTYRVFPADTLWMEREAFVNHTYPVFAPTIGVATLDALDWNGNLHENATSVGFEADHLTSLPLNLDGLSPADSVYLSFFYQAEGYGDAPEPNDSLFLEFFSPESGEWYWMWGSKGKSLDDFEQVFVAVPDTAYDGSHFFLKGFQFRFVNYASLTGLWEASWASNVDFWNLDYIILDKNRSVNDTLITDLAFLDVPNFLLRDYTSMPWKHFSVNAAQMDDTLALSIANHRANSILIVRDIKIYDLINGGSPDIIVEGAGENFVPGTDTLYHPLNGYSFPTAAGGDAGVFRVEGVVKPGEIVADYSTGNDTCYYIQEFHDYYAYDDGTAERGYGLSEPGTENAMLAVRYKNYLTGDSLRAVDMYFNRTLGDANDKYFYLMVWDYDEENDQPGDVLFSQIGVRPQFTDSLNSFARYKFKTESGKDTAIATGDIFYVGWKQTTSDLLNIGFDKNRVRNENNIPNWKNPNIFYNITGGWNASSFEGAVMIRPVFSFLPLLGNAELPDPQIHASVYPNPAQTAITIELEQLTESSVYQLYTSTGMQVRSGRLGAITTRIDVADLSNGLYFLVVVSGNSKSGTFKILVQK